MTRRRLLAPALACLFMACAKGSPPPETAAPPTTAAPAPPATRIRAVWDGNYLNAALKLIREAKIEIDVVHFEWAWGEGTKEIQTALGEAVQRGVRVRVILDDEPRNSAQSLPYLENEGIDARLDESRTRIHAKIIVADRTRVLFGSTNLSEQSILRNHETNLLVENADVAEAFARYAEAIRANPHESVSLPEAGAAPGAEAAGIRVYFDRSFERALLALLDSARTRIDLQMYGTRLYRNDASSPSTRLLDALRRASARGVKVRVILERARGDWGAETNRLNEETAEYLAVGGCEVRFDRPDIISHAKLLFVDDKATVGSMNWGYGGLRQYHEVNAILTDRGAVADLEGYYAQLWNEASPIAGAP